MLPSRTAGSIGVDTDIFVFDDDVDVVVYFGGDHDRRERGMAFRV